MSFTINITSKNQIRRHSNIQNFFGDLKDFDDGRPLNEIRKKAQEMEEKRWKAKKKKPQRF